MELARFVDYIVYHGMSLLFCRYFPYLTARDGEMRGMGRGTRVCNRQHSRFAPNCQRWSALCSTAKTPVPQHSAGRPRRAADSWQENRTAR